MCSSSRKDETTGKENYYKETTGKARVKWLIKLPSTYSFYGMIKGIPRNNGVNEMEK